MNDWTIEPLNEILEHEHGSKDPYWYERNLVFLLSYVDKFYSSVIFRYEKKTI